MSPNNFKNNNFSRESRSDESQTKTRYEKLIEDVITAGINTKVLLLSATPVNNQISDLRNQISFIAGGDVSRDHYADASFREHLGLESVKETTRKAQAAFTTWSEQPPAERDSHSLLKRLGTDFFKLLDGLSIARSRKQIEQHYKEDMEKLGKFPERQKPESIHCGIDLKDEYPSFEALNAALQQLTLALYNPTNYLRPDLPNETLSFYRAKVDGFEFDQPGRERILIGMMKINFLKRLESSVDSFRLTLERTIKKIDELLQKFSEFEQSQQDREKDDYEVMTSEEVDDLDSEYGDFVVGKKTEG